MPTIKLKTSIPGTKSLALGERRDAAVPRGLSHATPVYVARAEGAMLEDVDGNRFLDFAGGIGCINIGHRSPGVLDAIEKQADRKSTRLNSSHVANSYAVFCLKKKKQENNQTVPQTKQ